jgi:hypothetical protein
MIELPKFTWYVQKIGDNYVANVYSGTADTDPQRGVLCKTVFLFKTFMKTDKKQGPEVFVAEYGWQFPWGSDRTFETVTQEFEATAEGVLQAQAWLNEKHGEGCGEA